MSRKAQRKINDFMARFRLPNVGISTSNLLVRLRCLNQLHKVTLGPKGRLYLAAHFNKSDREVDTAMCVLANKKAPRCMRVLQAWNNYHTLLRMQRNDPGLRRTDTYSRAIRKCERELPYPLIKLCSAVRNGKFTMRNVIDALPVEPAKPFDLINKKYIKILKDVFKKATSWDKLYRKSCVPAFKFPGVEETVNNVYNIKLDFIPWYRAYKAGLALVDGFPVAGMNQITSAITNDQRLYLSVIKEANGELRQRPVELKRSKGLLSYFDIFHVMKTPEEWHIHKWL